MNVSRRNLALLAMGAATLGAGIAKADTPFTSFAFNATGGTTPRTEPDRWADWHNVKDFGAVGNNIADDTAAIQACINWQTATAQRGTIYFPIGLYKITSPLELPTGSGASIILRGEGPASNLSGSSVSGYTINRYVAAFNAPSGLIVIEKMAISNNTTTAGTGAIRLGNCNGAIVRDCQISGKNGVIFNQAEDDPTFLSTNCSIINCTVTCNDPRAANTSGVSTGNYTTIINIDAGTWDVGVRMCGSGNALIGGRMEVNNTNIAWGVDHLGNTVTATGCNAEGFTTEAFFDTCFDFIHADGCGLKETGGNASTSGTYGVRVRPGASNCVIQSVAINGNITVAGFSIEDGSGSPRGNTFISCVLTSISGGGVSWIMPTKARTAQFINSNNLAPIFLFADLPSGADVVVGDEYIISNSNTATSAANFAATVGGGGANTAKVRWNGSNWIIC